MKDTKETVKVGWNFDNSYARLPKLFFTITHPTPVPSPKLVALNSTLATALGLNIHEMQKDEGLAILAGNSIPSGALPLAQAYAGHQFGHFTMLGDGRALLIGEQITPFGKRFDIQLKGPGRTPYSRRGDGRAALGPMLREYIISEAMHGLGIPTTRSLAVVTTGKSIIRETPLPGAILTRVASSHIRVGTFEYAAKWGNTDELQALADYTILRHYPDVNDDNKYLHLMREVVKRQAALIAKWQLVGFIHGVMNTDNMTISGETIDYGPCAFMDAYDPSTVFSSIDTHGRYAYGNQPRIAGWNLARFAETLLPLLHRNENQAVKLAQDEVGEFANIYRVNWLSGMRSKLGLFNEEVEDEKLIEALLNMMDKYRADYTNTFIALTFNRLEETNLLGSLEFEDWYKQWQTRLSRQEKTKEAAYQLMKSSNPALIPRNHRVEEALVAAEKKGNFELFESLVEALSEPYSHIPEQAHYATLPPKSFCQYKTFCGT